MCSLRNRLSDGDEGFDRKRRMEKLVSIARDGWRSWVWTKPGEDGLDEAVRCV